MLQYTEKIAGRRPFWRTLPFVDAGQSAGCSDREFVSVLDNLVSTINCDGLVSRVFLQQYIFVGYCSWVGLS